MAEEKIEWKLADLLGGKSVEEIEKNVLEMTKEFEKARSELSPAMSASRLKELILLDEDIGYELGRISSYYGMKFAENTQDQEALGALTKFQQLGTDIANRTMFFGLWLMELSDEEAQKFIDAPELAEYKYFLESIRHDKPFTKTEEIEKIMNLKSMTGRGAFADVYDILTNDFSYELDGEKKTQAEMTKLYHSQNPEERQKAYEEVLGKYGKNKNVLAEIYKNVVLDWNNSGVKIRGHPKAIAVRDHINDIEDEAVQALIKVVRKNASIFWDYFKIKHKLNGEKYEYSRYHLYAPFEKEVKKEYSYSTSKDIVLEAYKEFDEEFYTDALKIFNDEHVHGLPQKNKRSGAFCSFTGRGMSPYILLNHTGTMRDVFTMMHEFGHGIHDILADEHPLSVAHPCLPMAETGSISGETILAAKLMKTASDEEKVSMLISNIDDRWASIVRQIYFVAFEQEAHKMIQEGATASDLDEKYLELLKEQFGDMDIPAEFANEWNYIPHIHHTPFYCYAYAWGNLLALSLYKTFEEEGKAGKQKLISVLRAGGSKSPKDILADAGFDPKDEEFWQKGINIVAEQIAELKRLVE